MYSYMRRSDFDGLDKAKDLMTNQLTLEEVDKLKAWMPEVMGQITNHTFAWEAMTYHQVKQLADIWDTNIGYPAVTDETIDPELTRYIHRLFDTLAQLYDQLPDAAMKAAWDVMTGMILQTPEILVSSFESYTKASDKNGVTRNR